MFLVCDHICVAPFCIGVDMKLVAIGKREDLQIENLAE